VDCEAVEHAAGADRRAACVDEVAGSSYPADLILCLVL
jgi:hypothetical protein